MAWTGSAIVTSLGKNIVRITGVSLAAGASGTIGPASSSPMIELPSSFPSASDDDDLTIDDLVIVQYTFYSAVGAEAAHVHINKQTSPFLITFENDTLNNSSPLDIYIHFLHSLVR